MEQNIDLSIRRRKYCREGFNLITCPECDSILTKKRCSVLLYVKSDTNEGKFITNFTENYFCNNCPVVVFDTEKVKQAAEIIIRGNDNLKYLIEGIVDLASIPKEKSNLEIGTDENPVPLVHFLPDMNKTTFLTNIKIGRNEPCHCGSGKKYKKCCGR